MRNDNRDHIIRLACYFVIRSVCNAHHSYSWAGPIFRVKRGLSFHCYPKFIQMHYQTSTALLKGVGKCTPIWSMHIFISSYLGILHSLLAFMFGIHSFASYIELNVDIALASFISLSQQYLVNSINHKILCHVIS
jgi:hypothetical protein